MMGPLFYRCTHDFWTYNPETANRECSECSYVSDYPGGSWHPERYMCTCEPDRRGPECKLHPGVLQRNPSAL